MNERTSKRVAKIAGRIMHMLENNKIPKTDMVGTKGGFWFGTVGEIEALAASALTQTADQPKAAKK